MSGVSESHVSRQCGELDDGVVRNDRETHIPELQARSGRM